MKIQKINTKRGLELKGAFFDAPSKDTILIMLTGICSNIFQNELLYTTGLRLQENGIACIIAHAMDSFSCFSYTDHSIKKQRVTGVVFDEFDKVYEDVESYVIWAKNEGYKKIILAGHSLGSNKIINYLGNTPDDFVDYFIVSCPVDLAHWWKVMPNIDKCLDLAKQYIDGGNGDYIMPWLFGGFSPMTANTVMDFYNAENLKNCPVLSNDGEFDSLYNIKPNGLFLIGAKDSVTGDSPKAFMEKVNSYTKHPNKNKVIEVQGASHIFYNMHNEYADAVLKIVNEFLNI
ncbi:MAG: DUF1749 domain-containing protein [Muribaculaceae bacterium]|nr:DUF1749 domain-containing protein [Muribaculaceae bacterium]